MLPSLKLTCFPPKRVVSKFGISLFKGVVFQGLLLLIPGMGDHYQLQYFFTREPCVCACWPIAQLQTHWSMTKNIEFRIWGVGNWELTNRSLGEFTNKIEKKRAKKDGNLPYTPWTEKHALQKINPSTPKEINRTSKDLLNHHSKRWKMYANFRGFRTRTFDRSWSSFMASAAREWSMLGGAFHRFSPEKIYVFCKAHAKGD